MAGVGWGEARHETEAEAGDGRRETGDLSMRMASLGVRRGVSVSGGVALALRADAGVMRLESEAGPGTIHGLSADAWRLRAGVEASRRFELGGGRWLGVSMEAAGRQDGGDGLVGSGTEVAGGVSYEAPGGSVEARGRWLAAHSGEDAREKGVSVAVRTGAGAGGRGPWLALEPRWGAETTSGGALWDDERPRAAAESGALDARLGYGFDMPGGVLTPFAEVGLAGAGGRTLGFGMRFDAPGGRVGGRGLGRAPQERDGGPRARARSRPADAVLRTLGARRRAGMPPGSRPGATASGPSTASPLCSSARGIPRRWSTGRPGAATTVRRTHGRAARLRARTPRVQGAPLGGASPRRSAPKRSNVSRGAWR